MASQIKPYPIPFFKTVLLIVFMFLAPGISAAATPLQSISYVPDVTVVLGGVTVAPNSVAMEDLNNGTVTLLPYGPFPDGVHITAYHRLTGGDQLFSFDTVVTFLDDFVVRPGDVVRLGRLFDPETGEEYVLYTLEFDAAAAGLPDGVMVDAVTLDASSNLLLSFDTAFTTGGLTCNPQDLVRYAGSTFTIALNGTAIGVPAGLNIDGAQYLPSGHYLLSFDGSGQLNANDFDDEDILEFDPEYGTWEKAYDGSEHFEAWGAADLGAFLAVPSATIPTVSTVPVIGITSTSATGGGEVTSDGGSPMTVRGVCWGTDVNPGTGGSCTYDLTPSTGPFSGDITGLTPVTTYHVRAYASNAAGTAYGTDLTFATPAGLPTLAASLGAVTTTTAAAGGYVYTDGGAAVTARGVCWGATPNPDLGGNCSSDGSSGTGSFAAPLTGLTPNTTYYLRAYATNSVGTAYSTNIYVGTMAIAGQDPFYAWHTFYGVNSYSNGDGVATDAAGNIYVVGNSSATWAGPAGQLPLHPFAGSSSLFVLKLDPAGGYLWHAFYQAEHNYRHGIAVDSAGNSYVTSGTSTGWAGPAGQEPLHPFSSGSNLLVLKLDTGGGYQWHTFYGGGPGCQGIGIAVRGSDLYVTGQGYSSWRGPGNTPPLNDFSSDWVTYTSVLKLDIAGTYRWHTFYGINSGGHMVAIAGDSSVYVSGPAYADWAGAGVQAPRSPYNQYEDSYVLKLSPAGGYQWHTFHGSDGFDTADGLVVDGSGSAYVTGRSTAGWNGPAGQAPLNSYASGNAIYALKVDGAGDYQWHTFYGAGDCYNSSFGIVLDSAENVYVNGVVCQPWNGPSGQRPVHAFGGNNDAFVLKLGGGGAYQWHTFYGPNNTAVGLGIDAADNILVTGQSFVHWNGPEGQPPLNDTGYAFTLKLKQAATPDSTPDPFTFTDHIQVALNHLSVSNAITVSGINVPAPVSISGGEYRINGSSWTAAGGTVVNGDSVDVRQTSSATGGVTTDTLLTIGGVSDTFSVTTLVPPTVITTSISGRAATSFAAGGSVVAEGSVPVTGRGICWGTSPDPSLGGSCMAGGSGTGAFSVTISGLALDSSYHVRAYATNSAGAFYGADIQFTTSAPVGPFAYITNQMDNTLSVIDTSSNRVVSTIAVGSEPRGVALHGALVYLANTGDGTVSIIDAASNTVIGAPIPVGITPVNLAITPSGTTLYAGDINTQSVYVIDTASKTVGAEPVPVNSPWGLAVHPGGSPLYAVSSGENRVWMVNTSTNTIYNNVPVGSGPRGAAVTPDGGVLYVADAGSNDVTAINTGTYHVIATIPVGSGPRGVVVTPDGSKVYVTNQDSNSVSVIATGSNTVITTIPVQGGPYGIDVDQSGSSVYAVNRISGSVSVIDTASDTVSATINVGSSPYVLGRFIGTWTTDMTKFTLTVQKTGSGDGSITPGTGSLTWTGTTGVADYSAFTTLTLLPTPDKDSRFSGWSGACSGSGDCTLTMDAPKSVMAEFAYVPPVQVSEIYNFFSLIGDAYATLDALAMNGTILAREFQFTESPLLDKSRAVVLKGGYDSEYQPGNGYSTIRGSLKIRSGSLRVQRIVVRPPPP